jgi:hypothetical protein
MGSQNGLEQLPARNQRRVVKGSVGEHRREARDKQQLVAIAKRHIQLLCELQYHPTTWTRPTTFDKTEVPLRNIGSKRKLQLTQSSPLAPYAQCMTDNRPSRRTRLKRMTVHVESINQCVALVSAGVTRGHGRTDGSALGLDLDTFADDLAAVIDRLDLRELVLAGHSAMYVRPICPTEG